MNGNLVSGAEEGRDAGVGDAQFASQADREAEVVAEQRARLLRNIRKKLQQVRWDGLQVGKTQGVTACHSQPGCGQLKRLFFYVCRLRRWRRAGRRVLLLTPSSWPSWGRGQRCRRRSR